MLKRTDDIDIAGETIAVTAPLPAPIVAARVAAGKPRRAIVLAESEPRAEAIARLAAAFAPDAVVVYLPASDALPGDAAPATAANVGQRVEALRRLRATETNADAAPILLVLSAEASAVRYAEPAAFDEAPPVIRAGDPIDPAAFAARAADIGYIEDDRVDEPGEIAVRGGVIDVFPADRDTPVRIEFADGLVTALRAYDPVTQRGGDAIEALTIGRATEPPMGEGVPVTAHLPGGIVHADPGAGDRRDRFLALANDGRARRRTVAGLVDDRAWQAAVGDVVPLVGDVAEPPPRFVERRDPAAAFRRFAKALATESRLAIAGSARDLRFLAPRIGRPTRAIDAFEAALTADIGTVSLLVAPVDRGFVHGSLVVVAAADLLGSRARLDDMVTSQDLAFGEVAELHIGDLVVHEDHGIGSIAGIEPLASDGEQGAGGDAIVLTYAKGARRLVPVGEAGRIWRYGADAEAVSLDALDGASWIKRRAGIDVAIAESARALQALAAARDARTTQPIVPAAAAYEAFAAGFPFPETPDQARAIAAVRHDLASGRPMDRLIVGDVGYGKTEVALRAAALVALAGRQVAIVAPTTVLVRQHLDTVRARFEGTGIAVASLSRLSSAAERKRVRAGLADGSIGVVVGTSAVAGKGIAYADLALVVIDEEQRFGAKAKASLRALGAGHVLTLSATPIPRTLQSAMVGLQAMSIIASPPARRQAIRTTVAAFEDERVRRALRRERARGGQSFVVVPRIEDIAPLAETLARIVPELGVVVAHGKLDPAELDDAMAGFANGDGDVLLATNIIEAGLDVPRANTMIVHHADRFGLSQLHQLRGRVGRGGRRGQIMLATAGDATIAEATMKRLRTLQAFDQLGAGFAISARDLDMRGAGDLVGEEQAGHMKLIGIDLYQHLLGQALHAARGEEQDRWQPVLNLGVVGSFPETWIPEADLRLTLYGRLARLGDIAAFDAFQGELEDRFGALPDPATHLLDAARIGALAQAAGIRQVDSGPGAIALTPGDSDAACPPPFEPVKRRWLVRERIEDPVDRLERTRALLGDLAGDA